jgi:hypothetical protein
MRGFSTEPREALSTHVTTFEDIKSDDGSYMELIVAVATAGSTLFFTKKIDTFCRKL